MKLKPGVIAVALVGIVAWSSGSAAEAPAPPAAPPERPCSRPEAKQFDFWLGDWDLTWASGGRGTNSITRALDGCAIMENFIEAAAAPLRGTSLSVFDAELGKWQQTWVDNQGSYLDFTGGLEKDGRMVLQRKGMLHGKPVLQRMIWHDIQPGSLTWNWERSEDGGATWKVVWQIAYRRRSGGPAS